MMDLCYIPGDFSRHAAQVGKIASPRMEGIAAAI